MMLIFAARERVLLREPRSDAGAALANLQIRRNAVQADRSRG